MGAGPQQVLVLTLREPAWLLTGRSGRNEAVSDVSHYDALVAQEAEKCLECVCLATTARWRESSAVHIGLVGFKVRETNKPELALASLFQEPGEVH
jgi:hypothetical protein